MSQPSRIRTIYGQWALIKCAILLLLVLASDFGLAQINKSLSSNQEETQFPKEKDQFIDQPTEFPGGMAKFYRYISKNIRYPKSVKKDGVQGKVYVRFVVQEDGSIDDESVQVVTAENLPKSSNSFTVDIITDHECEQEALRLLRECPKWKPPKQQGKPARQQIILPITFRK